MGDTALGQSAGGLVDATSATILVGFGAAAYASRALGDAQGLARSFDGSFLDGPIDVADRWGDGATLGVAALALLGAGHVAGDTTIAAFGEDLTGALLRAWAVTWALKLAIPEKRPSGGPHSFPSGHTSTAFAAAPVIGHYLGRTAEAAAYGIATLTGLARLEDRMHYPPDILVGAAIGILAGRSVIGSSSLRLGGPGLVGVSLRF